MPGEIRDIRMIQKAFEQRWPIEQVYRETLVAKLMRIVADPNSKNRESIAAAKALIAAEKQNQEDEHKLIDVRIQQRNSELDAIAADLGIEPSLIVDAQRESGSSDSSTEIKQFKAG